VGESFPPWWSLAARSRTFIRSPGFETPTECWSWLFEQGVRHHDGWVEPGASGRWRGSGEVTGG
jgi:hypothetical protein